MSALKTKNRENAICCTTLKKYCKNEEKTRIKIK